MTQIRWLIDEDAQHRGLAPALRARGVDIVTASEAGLSSRDDAAVLAYAAGDLRTIYTFNVGDFCRLQGEYLAHHRPHSGIVVVPRQRYMLGEQLRRLHHLMNTLSADDMHSRLEFL